MGLRDIFYKIGRGFGEIGGTYNTVTIPRKAQPGPPAGPYSSQRPKPQGMRPVPGIELEDDEDEESNIPRQARGSQQGAMNPRAPNMRMCLCCIVMIVIFTIMTFLFGGSGMGGFL